MVTVTTSPAGVPRRRLSVCFVCLGNICRSPTAEAVMRRLVDEAGLSDRVRLSSAGTGAWHVGNDADPRARATFEAAGYRLDHAARQFVAGEFAEHDLVVAMDRANERDLRRLAQTDGDRAKVRLLRSYDPEADDPDVPDPYYDADDGFRHVLDVVERGCRGLLAEVEARLVDA